MKNRNIHSRDISIVVQGAVSPRLTSQSLKQLRKLFPESEIILSTWEDSDTKNLNYDILVLNVDPGGYQDRYVKTLQTIRYVSWFLLSRELLLVVENLY